MIDLHHSQLDLFVSDRDGVVWSNWWNLAQGWRPEGWFPIHPETRATVGTPVTALWSNLFHLDLFMAGPDGAVQSTWWEVQPGWQKWFSIHPEIKAQPGARVTAQWSSERHLDLFMTGTDGTV